MVQKLAKSLHDRIGLWFEQWFLNQFPDFTRSEGILVPDFENHSFLVETKAGYFEYGAYPKHYQLEAFSRLSKPVIYVLGFHHAKGLLALKNRSTKVIHTALSSAGLHSLYFVSDSIVRTIWEKECRTAKQDPDWKYFALRPGLLETIIDGRSFSRKGEHHTCSSWYGFDSSSLVLRSSSQPEQGSIRPGLLLDRIKDQVVLEYFAQKDSQGILPKPC